MKRFFPLFTLFTCLFFWQFNANAQLLNRTADWTNSSWTLTGTYSSSALLANPATSGNFSYDDDEAGLGSTDELYATSPVIDLTTANMSGEFLLNLSFNYNFYFGDEFIVEYYDADSIAWILWETIPENSISTSAWCSSTMPHSGIAHLNVCGFTATQLSGFRYRFYYDATLVWGFGLCMDPPNISSAAPSGCLEPSDLSISNIGVTTADFNWKDNTCNSATDSHIEIVPTGAGQGTGIPVIAGSTTSYSTTGLSAFTDYDFYVRSFCGIGDSSSWVGPLTFRTTGPGGYCENPLTQSIESDCGAATPISIDFTSAPDIGSRSCDFSAPNYGYWYSFVAPASGAVNLSASNGASSVSYEVVDSCGNQANVQVCGHSLDDGDSVALIGLTPLTTYYIVYWRGAQAGSGDFCLEEESCPGLANIAVGNITSTAVELSWTNTLTDFVIEWGIDGFSPGTGTLVATSTNPFTLSGLIPNTDYDFYIRGVCTPHVDSTDWIGPISFTTSCIEKTPDYAADFSTSPPDCWNEAGSGYPTAGPSDLGFGYWNPSSTGYTGFTNTNKINLYTTTRQDWLISPKFDLTGGGALQLVVNTGITDYNKTTADPSGMAGTDDSVVILMTLDGSTWTSLHVWDASNYPTLAGDQFVYDLTGLGLTAPVQFAIWGKDGPINDLPDYDFHIGQFEVRVPPACMDPASLIATSLTDSSAYLGWAQNGGSLGWELEYGPLGFTQGSGTTITTTSNPQFITGLSETTQYSFYVRNLCMDTASVWIGPSQFTTLCAIKTPDYFQNFDVFMPDCWSQANDGAVAVWKQRNFANDASSPNGNAAVFNIYLVEADTLFTPKFDLSSGGPFKLEHHIAATEYNSSSLDAIWEADDSITLNITTDGGATWAPLMAYHTENNPGVVGTIDTMDLSAYSGTVQFAYIARSTVNGSGDIDVFVDSFHIFAVPTDPCPTSLHVTGTTATGTIQADVNMTSDATIHSPNDVIFKAGSQITLGDNGSGSVAEFEVEVGAVFETIMEPCAGSSPVRTDLNEND